jgi:hypothetical protein
MELIESIIQEAKARATDHEAECLFPHGPYHYQKQGLPSGAKCHLIIGEMFNSRLISSGRCESNSFACGDLNVQI